MLTNRRKGMDEAWKSAKYQGNSRKVFQGKYSRCLSCRYYKCVCMSPKRYEDLDRVHPVNKIEQRSRRYHFSRGLFTKGRIIHTNPGADQRMVVQKETKTVYCLKTYPRAKIEGLRLHSVLENEKRIMERISERNPFIQSLIATFEDEEARYLLLEYLGGGVFFGFLRSHGPLPVEDVKFYSAELYLAIRYLQSLKIAHRDIRPENIYLDDRGHIKLSGFALGKFVQQRTFTICGTPEYMAPEIFAQQGYDCCVDWWSFGIVLYEMTMGHPPVYASVDEPNCVSSVLELVRENRPPAKARNCIEPKLWDFIVKILTVDVQKREETAQDLFGHALFKFFRRQRFDWSSFQRRTISPPHVPTVQSSQDTSNYPAYPDFSSIHLASKN